MINIELNLDPMYDHYHRTVFGIQTWLIAIGGISRAIMIGGLIFSQRIAGYLYKRSIIENLFMGRSKLSDLESRNKHKK